MIMEFRKSKIAYFVLLLLASALILVLLIPLTRVVNGERTLFPILPHGPVVTDPLLRWIGVIVGLFAAQMVASAGAVSLGNKEFQKLAAVLLSRCDSDTFFEKSAPLLKKGSRQSALVKNYILGKGYVARGEFEKAIALCSESEREGKVDWITHDMRISLCGAYANACIAYVETGDPAAAVKLYSRIKATAEATVGNKDAFAAADYIRMITRDYIAVFAKEGFSDTAALEQDIEKASSEYDRVLLHDALARMQERLGNDEEAGRNYRYVAENGNTFACAKRARERLAQA